ncbi:DUF4349 domain-containing protein [Bacillus sp. FJAT-49736]|uniref:DUF4349 domain-containing protein n=1 Tax=Bacillus sp. FJAT-49736 TaxID=2833582 RepID=UPI001BCA6344|nr:DUF4349 domain-containing protein [Bacillus sp. FJAT-49736]MBS4174876.1 DUF4349 domain-containing protein [Bacillus sp. FJAT-49736]
MRFWKSFVLICFSMVLLIGCSSNSESSKSSSKSSYDVASRAKMNESVKQDSVSKTGAKKEINVLPRKVIYNADLEMEVKHLSKIQDQIKEMVAQMGGYIVQQRVIQGSRERQDSYLTVRVPQEHFQEFLNKIKPLGVKVDNQNIDGKDVTEEYVDLQSRLKSKKLAEKRLIQFMNEAKDTKTLLEISNELSRVQEEVETLEGQIKYINNQVDLSTISINLYENKVIVPGLENNQLNTWEKTKKQFMKSINFLISFLSGLIVFIIGNLPVILLLGVIAFIVFWIWRRRSKEK